MKEPAWCMLHFRLSSRSWSRSTRQVLSTSTKQTSAVPLSCIQRTGSRTAWCSTVDVTMDRYRGTAAQQYAVSVEVTTSRGEPATGAVSVWVDAVEYTGILADGRVTFALPAQSRGIHVVVAEYAGDVGVDGSTGVSGFVVD